MTNISITYWLPSPNFVFSPTTSTPWTTLSRDTSQANRVSPTTRVTYYAYTTRYPGTGDPTSTIGPAYAFSSPSVSGNSASPNSSYYYQITYTLNGITQSNPLQAISNP